MPSVFQRWSSASLALLLSCLVSPGVKLRADTPSPDAGAVRPALTVSVTTPVEGRWPQTIAATGNIAAWEEMIVGAEAGGLRLTEILVNVGDRVKKGQLLAQLNSDTVAAELAATRASLAEADAMLAEARLNAERARQLKGGSALSAQQINQYLTAEQTARARLEALKARLKLDQLRLEQTRILAPDDGIVVERLATLGAVVQAGQQLFRLVRQGRLEWRAEVAASDLARITPGMGVAVTPAGGATLHGKVRVVAPTVDPQTRNGLVYVDLPSPGEAKAGMFARGEFALGDAEGLMLPQSAVLLRDGFSYVFTVGDDAKVRLAKVTTGRRIGERIEITGGLGPKARVVGSGGAFLTDGDTVRISDK